MKIIFPLLIVLVFWAGSATFAGQVPRIDKDELKAMLGEEDLVILDVRQGGDWDASKFKIMGAERVENGDLSERYPKEMTIVIYCA